MEYKSECEIDIAIAEKVFGFKVNKVKPDWYPYEVLLFYHEGDPLISYSWDENACNAMMHANGRDGSDGTAPPLPHYSVEPEGREWEIVDAMIELHGCHFRLCGFDTSYRTRGTDIEECEPHREYEAEFKPKGYRGDERFIATASRPELAICLAALKAVEVSGTVT